MLVKFVELVIYICNPKFKNIYMRKMSILLSVVLMSLMFVSCLSKQEDGVSINVMTYNLRYSNSADAPHHWDARKEGALEVIKREKVDLLGIQEGLISQINYLDSALTNYKRVGVGRDDGKSEGEFSAIYYDADRFESLENGTIWLSETPNQVSQGWDGACRRIMSYVVLKEKNSDKEITYFNTHFDHVGKVARDNSSKLVIETIKKVANGRPVIFSGDLNATIEDEPIQYLLNQGVLLNSRDIAETKLGVESTYHDFGKIDGGVIDYIMVSEDFKVKSSNIISEQINGLYLSDHNPIVVTIVLN